MPNERSVARLLNQYEQDLYNGPLPQHAGEPPEGRLAWLAGFTDGEGTITLAVRMRPNSTTISPKYSLINTNLANLGRARVILASLTGHDVRISLKRRPAGERPAYTISLSSQFDVRVTLEALYGHLVGKWPQAHAVLEFLTIAPGRTERSSRSARPRRVTPPTGAIYDERHWTLVRRVRELNRRFAAGEWQAYRPLDPGGKPETAPGHEPMDPLKRWYKLYVG